MKTGPHEDSTKCSPGTVTLAVGCARIDLGRASSAPPQRLAFMVLERRGQRFKLGQNETSHPACGRSQRCVSQIKEAQRAVRMLDPDRKGCEVISSAQGEQDGIGQHGQTVRPHQHAHDRRQAATEKADANLFGLYGRQDPLQVGVQWTVGGRGDPGKLLQIGRRHGMTVQQGVALTSGYDIAARQHRVELQTVRQIARTKRANRQIQHASQHFLCQIRA